MKTRVFAETILYNFMAGDCDSAEVCCVIRRAL